jgi:hypothetical protein
MDPHEQQILRDLTKHLQTKIVRNMDDYMKLVEVAGVDPGEALSNMIVSLVKIVCAVAAKHFSFTPDQFADIMRQRYSRIKKFADEEENE